MLLPEVADREGELRACATHRRVLPSNDVAPRLERSSCSAGLDRWTSSGPAPDAARARRASSALTEAMRLGVRCVSTTVRMSFRATTDSSARTARSRAPPGSEKQQPHCLWMCGSGQDRRVQGPWYSGSTHRSRLQRLRPARLSICCPCHPVRERTSATASLVFPAGRLHSRGRTFTT